MRKFTAILMTVLMIAGLFVSCDNNAPVVDETVSVSFDESTSRSLTASLEQFKKNDYYWKYTARKNSSDTSGLNSGATGSYDVNGALWIYGGSADAPTDNGLGSVAGFSQGIWDFTLFAYKLVDQNYKLVYQGEVTGVSLKKGSDNSVVVSVNPIEGQAGTLKIDDNITFVPKKDGNSTTGFTKVYTVTALGSTDSINPVDGKTNEWSLSAGAYKVKVDFVKDGYVYASGSVVATVYSNLTTTVSGELNELVTEAIFDSSINPDVMNKVVSSGDVKYSTLNESSQPVTLATEGDDKVKATVPAAAAKAVIESTVGEASNDDKVRLSVSVHTTSATSNSIELEIGVSATVTYTRSGTEVVETKPVSDFGEGNIITVQVELQKNLQNVKVTHKGNPMSVISESNSEGYSYNADTGILTIQTSSLSPFGITYDEPAYVATVGNMNYTALQDAVDASDVGDTIILQDDVVLSESLVISGGKELTIELNGFNISAPSSVIKIVHANVTLTGTGTIYELNDDGYGAVLLYGAATDKGANYSVVNVDENVTLRGWSGIFVSIDEAGTYKNYGIVANIKGNIVLPGMDTHETRDGAGIYINGQNNNTEGNVPVFNLDGAEITGNSGIYAAGYAKWNLKNVTIEADSEALSIKAGEFVIDSGNYTAIGEFADPSEDTSNGSVETGAALSMTSNSGYAHKVDVTVNGGRFVSQNGYAVYEGIPNDSKEPHNPVAPESYVTLSINGGEFVGNAEKGAIKLSTINQSKVITGGSFTDLASAIKYAKSGAEIKLLTDSVGNGIVIPSGSNLTVDFNGHTFDINGELVGSSGTETNSLQLLKDSEIVFKNGTLTSSNSTYQSQILIQNYSNLTLENMTVKAGLPFDYILSNNNGNVRIKDTTITAAEGKVAFDVCRYASYVGPHVTVEGNSVINGKVEISSSGAKDDAVHKLTVTGGTFNGKIYKSGSCPDFVGDIKGGSFTDLASVIPYASRGAVINLKDGVTVTLDNGIANEGANSRDITFIGDGSQTVDVITNTIYAENGWLNYQRGSSFTFENLTIKAGEGSFDGIVCDELTFKNCTIKGKLTMYGKATFINCVFDNTMANQYSIWTWGGTDVTFEGCTFDTNGKAILLYGGSSNSNPTNLVVKGCTFNDRKSGVAGKAAIEIGNDYNSTYTLTVNNATVNGFAAGKNTGSKLWANKNSMDAAHLTVTIDGTRVH